MTTIARTVSPMTDAATSRLARARSRLAALAARVVAWWRALEPGERIFYRGATFLGIGMGLWWPPFVLIVPGLLWTLVFFGFDMRRHG